MPLAPANPTPPIAVESGTLGPTLSPPPTRTPTPTDTGWEALEAGLERRTIRILDDEGSEIDRVVLLRIEPALFRFDVAYAPGEPKSLLEWSEATGALITINGGFFTAEYQATGLTIVNGTPSGWSYDFGGMVAITSGTPRVRSLAVEPYQAGEAIDAGLQAFPMLIHPDGSGFTQQSNDRARRTVIAQDDAGRILLILTARSNFTLPELSDFLRNGDLNLQVALNLDGGTSTGLILTEPRIEVPAFVLMPAVLTVYRR